MSSPDPGWFGEFISYLNGTSQWNSLEVLAKSRTFLLPSYPQVLSWVFEGLDGRLWPSTGMMLSPSDHQCQVLQIVMCAEQQFSSHEDMGFPERSEGRTKYVMSKKVMSSYEFNMLWLYIYIYIHMIYQDISSYDLFLMACWPVAWHERHQQKLKIWVWKEARHHTGSAILCTVPWGCSRCSKCPRPELPWPWNNCLAKKGISSSWIMRIPTIRRVLKGSIA